MNIVRLFLAMLCPAAFGAGAFGVRLAFDGGGAGNSASTTNTFTEQNDMRVVGGEGSTNSSLKVDGTGNTVNAVDHGAVAGGLALALRGVEDSHDIAKVALASSGSILDGAFRNTSDMSTKLIATTGDLVGDALRNSNDQGRDLISATRSLLGDALAGGNLLARDAMSNSNALVSSAISATGQQSHDFADQARQFTESIKDIKTSDVRVLVIAGLAVVGLGAVMLLKKG
jgi:hypothetical protein